MRLKSELVEDHLIVKIILVAIYTSLILNDRDMSENYYYLFHTNVRTYLDKCFSLDISQLNNTTIGFVSCVVDSSQRWTMFLLICCLLICLIAAETCIHIVLIGVSFILFDLCEIILDAWKVIFKKNTKIFLYR